MSSAYFVLGCFSDGVVRAVCVFGNDALLSKGLCCTVFSSIPASAAHSGCHLQHPHQPLAKGRHVCGSQLDSRGSGPIPESPPASPSTLSFAIGQCVYVKIKRARLLTY